MNALFATAVAVALGVTMALGFAPRDGFETETFIEAPPATVWAVLTDPVEHERFSPNLHKVEGRFAVGERISLTMGAPSGGEITFRPKILAAQPEVELRWLGRLGAPRIFDGEHYFQLVAERGGTRLVQGERFHGVLLLAMDVQQFRSEFELANQGLKARAESLASRPVQRVGLSG